MESLESRLQLSSVGFVAHKIVENDVWAPTTVRAADIDGDGDMDAVSASSKDNKIAWFENIGGEPRFASQRVITTEAGFDFYAGVSEAIHTADVDGDGDIDLLSVSSKDSRIVWYENIDGKGTFGDQAIIATRADRATSVNAADLDGDGDMDVLSAFSASPESDEIVWYENTDGKGAFGNGLVISTQVRWTRSLSVEDLDGDGDMDVVSASSTDGKVAWYENTDGKGAFGKQRVIAVELSANSVHTADIDGDGDVDVVSGANTISWHENTDGNGRFEKSEIIDGRGYDSVRSVFASDLDGDGDVDVLSFSWQRGFGDSISWYENANGEGSFGAKQVIATNVSGARSVQAADLTGDGYLDVLFASAGDDKTDKIAWYENVDGKGSFGIQNVITANTSGARSVHATDLDSDGDVDVLSAFDHKVVWYENTDGEGTFGDETVVTVEAGGSAIAADLDGDGDMDVLLSSDSYSKLAWYENTDGKGTFGGPLMISTQDRPFRSVSVVDLDGDGDLDVASASGWSGSSTIEWYENTNGEGDFAPWTVIDGDSDLIDEVTIAQVVHSADVDGDGDMDILMAVTRIFGFPSTVAWYENTNGAGTFGARKVIAEAVFGCAAYGTDLDGDGDVDLLCGAERWYENVDGRGLFKERNIVTEFEYAKSVFATDLDDDGDVDVVSWSANDIAWYENTNGKGDFSQTLIAELPSSQPLVGSTGNQSLFGADVDGDGDVDILSATEDGTIAWYEARLAGDVDDDGRVAFNDFLVMAANFGTEFSATWEHGDFDRNGEVDFADFLLLAENFGKKIVVWSNSLLKV